MNQKYLRKRMSFLYNPTNFTSQKDIGPDKKFHKMDEFAILVNMSAILAKDCLMDTKVKSQPVKRKFVPHSILEDHEEDDLDEILLMQRLMKKKDCRGDSSKSLADRLSDAEIETNFHMESSTLRELIQIISPVTHLSASAISLGLWRLTTDEHYEQISRRFGLKLEGCQKDIRSFWSEVAQNKRYFLKWPNSIEQRLILRKNRNNDIVSPLRGYFGGILLEQLDIFFECQNKEIPVVLQIVCDLKHRILDCFVDFASCYSFGNSPIGRKLEEEGLAEDSYLIGDRNFPLKEYLLTPFDKKQGKFNRSEKMWNTLVDRVDLHAKSVLYKMMKRFNTLYALETKDLEELKMICDTICCIHNLCLDVSREHYGAEVFVQDKDFRIDVDDKDIEGNLKRIQVVKEIDIIH